MKRSALMVTVIPVLAIGYLVYEFARPPWTPMRLTGLILMAPALVLLTISRIRNPIYVFGTFVFSGLFLFLERPYLLLLLVPVLILQISRARAEARVLEEHFGDNYRRYRASTWF